MNFLPRLVIWLQPARCRIYEVFWRLRN